MSAIPYMQFQAYNPMDTALQAALGVYEGLGQGKQRRLQSQMLEQQIPYQGQLLEQQLRGGELGNRELETRLQYAPQLNEAQLGLIGAQTQNQAQDAAKNKQILEMMQNYLGGGQNGFSSRGQSPLMQGNGQGMMGSAGPYPGPGAQEIYARRFAGLPELTPEEETAIKLWENMQMKSQEKSLEKNLGTGATISDIQKQQKGIATFLPALDEIINSPAPGIWGIGGTPNDRSAYDAKVNNALQKLISAEGWKGNDADKEEGNTLLRKRWGEDEEAYKSRLKNLRRQTLETNEILNGIKSGNTPVRSEGTKSNMSNLEEEAKKRGFKQVNGVWMKS